jgi:hypothetical protein
MFITRTHQLTAIYGTYIFPYVIGKVNEGRIWGPKDSIPLTGNLPDESLSNQLFSTNHRLGFVGAIVKSREYLIESICVATIHNVNMDVKIEDLTERLASDRESARVRKWQGFEGILRHAFGLEVR